jgi:hypothetical protein
MGTIGNFNNDFMAWQIFVIKATADKKFAGAYSIDVMVRRSVMAIHGAIDGKAAA